MEHDRAETNLGIAAEIQVGRGKEVASKQPKKRFVGRRQATEKAAQGTVASSINSDGAVQGGSAQSC